MSTMQQNFLLLQILLTLIAIKQIYSTTSIYEELELRTHTMRSIIIYLNDNNYETLFVESPLGNTLDVFYTESKFKCAVFCAKDPFLVYVFYDSAEHLCKCRDYCSGSPALYDSGSGIPIEVVEIAQIGFNIEHVLKVTDSGKL